MPRHDAELPQPIVHLLEPAETPVDAELDTDFSVEIAELTDVVDALAEESGIKPATWAQYKETIRPLAEHSPMMYAHSLRVGIYSYGIARSEGWKDLHFPLFAGCGPDVGPIGIDLDTLESTAKFTDEQYEDMKRHPEIGYHILKHTHLYSALIAGLHHAYRSDGYGLDLSALESPALSAQSKEKIESVAKLIMLVDFFDSLTTRKNDKGLATFDDREAQRAVLQEHFPDSPSRVDWLFDHMIARERFHAVR